MKKIVIFLSCFMVIPVFAEYINENTQLKWNSKVIEKALDNSGFINSGDAYLDVRTTRNHILEDLLTRQMFSITEAIDVCKKQCNKSDFLKNGRGQSGKKCPELCESFANNIIKVNKEQYTSVPVVSATSGDFSNFQGEAGHVCVKLTDDAKSSGISLPVLCGGRCDRFGQDKVQITDLVKTKEYEVDDFCNNDEKGRDYFYILTEAPKGAIYLDDVSSLNEGQRIVKLKETQLRRAQYYVVDRAKKDVYAEMVQQNGDCQYKEYRGYDDGIWIPEQDAVSYISDTEKNEIRSQCDFECTRYALSNACRINTMRYRAYARPSREGWVVQGFCSCNDTGDDVLNLKYTPTYEDCVRIFRDENKCLNKR